MIITPHGVVSQQEVQTKSTLAGEFREGPRGGRRLQPIICPINLLETLMLESMVTERCVPPKRTWVRPNMAQARQMVRDNPESQPHHWQRIIRQRAAWQSRSPRLLHPRPPPWLPFPGKPFALSSNASPASIHF